MKTIRQDECQLNCLAKGHMFFLKLLPKVKDGTPCLTDLKKVCIDGKCKVRWLHVIMADKPWAISVVVSLLPGCLSCRVLVIGYCLCLDHGGIWAQSLAGEPCSRSTCCSFSVSWFFYSYHMWYDTTDSVCITPCYLSARKQEIPARIQYPVWMSQKPRKRVFRALKSEKFLRGSSRHLPSKIRHPIRKSFSIYHRSTPGN